MTTLIKKPSDGDRLIYLASPYNHDDPMVMEARWWACSVAVAEFNALGEFAYSPILHNHQTTKHWDPGRHWDFWAAYDTLFLSRCDDLYVYEIDGYLISVGMAAEIRIAKDMGIPIRSLKNSLCELSTEELVEWYIEDWRNKS